MTARCLTLIATIHEMNEERTTIQTEIAVRNLRRKRRTSRRRQICLLSSRIINKEKPILVNGKELNQMETDDLIDYINGNSKENNINKSNTNGKKKNKKKKKTVEGT